MIAQLFKKSLLFMEQQDYYHVHRTPITSAFSHILAHSDTHFSMIHSV